MPPPRNRNPQLESLLNPTHPPAYATFEDQSESRGATSVDERGYTSEQTIQYYRTLRCAIFATVAIAFMYFCTISLPVLFKQLRSHQDHNWDRNHTAPAPIVTCPPCLTCPPEAPPPPPSPFQKFNDVPQPGSTYILTDSETGLVITYSNTGEVTLTRYRSSPDQQWTCREQDGWLGFSITPPGRSAVYLGFMNPPTLRCTAPRIQFNEMFSVVKRAGWGFRVYLRDGQALRPLGKDADGNLARVGASNIWWGFTRVDWASDQDAQKEGLDGV
ncbi:hypothetical protein TWF694_010189 [Orbilia ellipsospora]|uniref:Fucose-specific lectin n=1 Tax=Orbilia ellipsospora TaxID=2528407 RepID=A0AAV9XAH6_9PEZI